MLAVNQENEHLMEDYERLASDVSVSLTPSPGDPVETESSGHLCYPWPKVWEERGRADMVVRLSRKGGKITDSGVCPSQYMTFWVSFTRLRVKLVCHHASWLLGSALSTVAL